MMKFQEKDQETWVKYYSIDNSVLMIVGGDFSFSSSLAHAFGSRRLHKQGKLCWGNRVFKKLVGTSPYASSLKRNLYLMLSMKRQSKRWQELNRANYQGLQPFWTISWRKYYLLISYSEWNYCWWENLRLKFEDL